MWFIGAYVYTFFCMEKSNNNNTYRNMRSTETKSVAHRAVGSVCVWRGIMKNNVSEYYVSPPYTNVADGSVCYWVRLSCVSIFLLRLFRCSHEKQALTCLYWILRIFRSERFVEIYIFCVVACYCMRTVECKYIRTYKHRERWKREKEIVLFFSVACVWGER